ncbi:MAG: hypothetical protein U5R31_17155 [Acidimicrobiia bacterium]|nr:hypothetical protein [Acidimicrobiia bacterium]
MTRNGVLVGELRPIRRDQFVAVDTVLGVFGHAAPVSETFRDDLDRVLDHSAVPRA